MSDVIKNALAVEGFTQDLPRVPFYGEDGRPISGVPQDILTLAAVSPGTYEYFRERSEDLKRLDQLGTVPRPRFAAPRPERSDEDRQIAALQLPDLGHVRDPYKFGYDNQVQDIIRLRDQWPKDGGGQGLSNFLRDANGRFGGKSHMLDDPTIPQRVASEFYLRFLSEQAQNRRLQQAVDFIIEQTSLRQASLRQEVEENARLGGDGDWRKPMLEGIPDALEGYRRVQQSLNEAATNADRLRAIEEMNRVAEENRQQDLNDTNRAWDGIGREQDYVSRFANDPQMTVDVWDTYARLQRDAFQKMSETHRAEHEAAIERRNEAANAFIKQQQENARQTDIGAEGQNNYGATKDGISISREELKADLQKAIVEATRKREENARQAAEQNLSSAEQAQQQENQRHQQIRIDNERVDREKQDMQSEKNPPKPERTSSDIDKDASNPETKPGNERPQQQKPEQRKPSSESKPSNARDGNKPDPDGPDAPTSGRAVPPRKPEQTNANANSNQPNKPSNQPTEEGRGANDPKPQPRKADDRVPPSQGGRGQTEVGNKPGSSQKPQQPGEGRTPPSQGNHPKPQPPVKPTSMPSQSGSKVAPPIPTPKAMVAPQSSAPKPQPQASQPKQVTPPPQAASKPQPNTARQVPQAPRPQASSQTQGGGRSSQSNGKPIPQRPQSATASGPKPTAQPRNPAVPPKPVAMPSKSNQQGGLSGLIQGFRKNHPQIASYMSGAGASIRKFGNQMSNIFNRPPKPVSMPRPQTNSASNRLQPTQSRGNTPQKPTLPSASRGTGGAGRSQGISVGSRR